MPRRRDSVYDFYNRPYVRVADRQQSAARLVARLRAQGRTITPIERIQGRKIARTFWGSAWCDNLEGYSDYANRLPRGRTYVRNGSVIDLQIEPGRVTAMVSGSSVYEVTIGLEPLPARRWGAVVSECAGHIDSLVDLLAGKLAGGVMQVLARPETGLFPAPREIALRCSCPDWATMCKHVAATLYGVGARLDHAPELLFRLRRVDAMDLVAEAGGAGSLGRLRNTTAPADVLEGADLADLFGIDLDDGTEPPAAPARKAPTHDRKAKTGRRRVSARSTAARKQKPAPARPSRRSRTITARELLDRGVPRSTFQNWVTSGVLRKTDRRGVYQTTAATEDRIERTLERQRPARGRRR